MHIAIIDILGLPYDGNTLSKRGLGGSESWSILFSKELVKLGISVTVFNSCDIDDCEPGVYGGVEYLPLSSAANTTAVYDVVISSRSIIPYMKGSTYSNIVRTAKWRMVWLHDTFIDRELDLEDLLVNGHIDEAVTLSDWHTSYIMNCDHGKKRNFEVLKNHIYVSRNGIQKFNTRRRHIKKKIPICLCTMPVSAKVWKFY